MNKPPVVNHSPGEFLYVQYTVFLCTVGFHAARAGILRGWTGGLGNDIRSNLEG